MATETITLQIDADAARVFTSASADEREKLQALFGVWLREYAKAGATTLKQTMDEIGARAQARGLPPEIFDAILEAE